MVNAYWVGVQDSTHTAEARRKAIDLAFRLGFDETEAGNVGLVVTEASKNLLKHAGGGDLIVRAVEQNGLSIVEMLAIDKGPGIENIGRSFQDGYSTTGTPGTGLGAISRLSSLHDIYSQHNHGTTLLAQIGRRGARFNERQKVAGQFQIGAVSLAKPGEPVCGDDWGFTEHPQGGRLIVADGLGHGILAADAARAAVRVAWERSDETGAELVKRIHDALRPTRGAAVAVAEIDTGRMVVRYTGVGNIAGSIVRPSGAVQHLVSHAGTAGHEVHKIAEFTYSWQSGCILIMHSDGLGSQWSLDPYPGLLSKHPSLIAGVLYRDFTRRRDDVTVVVLHETGGTE